MTTVTPPDEDEPLPLPENWTGEPRFIVFIIPCLQSIPLLHLMTIRIEREEFVPWLVGTTHIPTDDETFDPDTLPISDGTNYVSLRIWRPAEKAVHDFRSMENAMKVANQILDRPAPQEPHPDPKTYDSGATVFEAVTPLLPVFTDGALNLKGSVSDAFDRCLEAISELVRAYVIASHDVRVEPITRQTLPLLIPWWTREPQPNGEYGGIGMFRANDGASSIARISENIEPELLNKVLIFLSRLKRRDPFLAYTERMRSSRRAHWYKGDYLTTVIDTHTAAEVLFDTLLLLMAWEEKVRPEEAAAWFNERQAKRLRTHYGPRLGGDWNTNSATGVIGRWARDVRDVRDACLHKGQVPSDVQARVAIECMESVDAFVREHLSQSAHKYPRTTMLLLGKPGLERLGKFEGFIEQFAKTNAYSEPDWITWYRTWADDFEKERKRT